MRPKARLSHEAIALVTTAVFLLGLSLVLWADFKRNARETRTVDENRPLLRGLGSRSPGKSRRLPRQNAPARKGVWLANVAYSPTSKALSVDLRNRHGAPTKGVALQARLVSETNTRLAVSASLSKQSNGLYRSRRLNLSKGRWSMSLTGYRNSTFEFLLEQSIQIR